MTRDLLRVPAIMTGLEGVLERVGPVKVSAGPVVYWFSQNLLLLITLG